MPPRKLLAVIASLLVGIATLVAVPTEALAAPNFKAPFPCGQQWTYSHHSGEVRRALDFIRSDGGTTNGTPVLASAAGTAHRFSQPSGAGNYIAVEHGGGWKTYYFHLSAYSVAEGAQVAQGQQIGVTGSTGNSTGPHIHYEQLLNGVGQNIVINGSALSYPGSYGSAFLTSDNGCGSQPGKPFMTWGSGVTGPLGRVPELAGRRHAARPDLGPGALPEAGRHGERRGLHQQLVGQARQPGRLHQQHLHRRSERSTARRS